MDILLDGIVLGAQLAVLAVGLTVVFGLASILNLAYGQLVVLAAVTIATLRSAGVPVGAAIACGIVVPGMLAWLLDRSVLRAVVTRHGDERVMLALLVTLAVAVALDGLIVWHYPFTVLSLPLDAGAVNVAGVSMRAGSLAAAGVAALTLLVTGVGLRSTRLGAAIRAASDDEAGAQLCGINPEVTRRVAVVASGVLAGIVAVTQGLSSSVGAADGFRLTILALIVAVVGGLGSVAGAALAGLLLGIVHVLATAVLGPALTAIALLVVAAAAIVARQGSLSRVNTR